MANSALILHWAGSAAFLNKERASSEKGSWRNYSTTVSELLEWTAKGHAFTCPLALNTTNSPAFAGAADPTLGPYMRKTNGKSERVAENALATNVLCFDLDGDTTLEKLLSTTFVKTRALAVATSARHLRVVVDGQLQHRLRLFLATPNPVEIFIGNDFYKDPFWLWKEVRHALLEELCEELGLETIKDKSGDDLHRIWYGNTGTSRPIGGGDDRPAGELSVTIVGNTLPMSFVENVRAETEEQHIRSEETLEASEHPVGTPKQLKDAAYIFSNKVLQDWRATDYHEWVRLLHALKKLDPDYTTLLEPFLEFSKQSPMHDPCIEDILDRLKTLPPSDEIQIGITALRQAADEDCPGWQTNCGSIGSARQSVTAAGFVGTSTDICTLIHLQRMYQAAGREVPDFQKLLNPTPQPQPKKQQPTRRRTKSSFMATLQKQKRSRPRPKQVDHSLPLQSTRSEFNGYDEPAIQTEQSDSDF